MAERPPRLWQFAGFFLFTILLLALMHRSRSRVDSLSLASAQVSLSIDQYDGVAAVGVLFEPLSPETGYHTYPHDGKARFLALAFKRDGGLHLVEVGLAWFLLPWPIVSGFSRWRHRARHRPG